jgi:hypothetical protein
MDIVLVLLRLIHIFAAFAWVGVATAQVLLIGPAIAASGESGLRFVKAMNARPVARMIFPVAAGLTMLAGILLYLIGNASSHFSQTGNLVLGIGAIAGLAAGIHGAVITGRSTAALGEAVNQYVGDAEIAAEGLPIIRQRAIEATSHIRVSYVLMLIALLGMGMARYL